RTKPWTGWRAGRRAGWPRLKRRPSKRGRGAGTATPHRPIFLAALDHADPQHDRRVHAGNGFRLVFGNAPLEGLAVHQQRFGRAALASLPAVLQALLACWLVGPGPRALLVRRPQQVGANPGVALDGVLPDR